VVCALRLLPSGWTWEGWLDPKDARDGEVWAALLRDRGFDAWFFDGHGRPLGGKVLSKLAPVEELAALWEGARADPGDYETARREHEAAHVAGDFLRGVE